MVVLKLKYYGSHWHLCQLICSYSTKLINHIYFFTCMCVCMYVCDSELKNEVCAKMDIQNIDTDMIIPKQFLKTIQRSGEWTFCTI